MSLFIWFIAGVLAICGALCYAELGCAMPQSGGEHPYFMRAYGSLPAFLFAFTGITLTRPASIAIISIVFSEYVARLFTSSQSISPIIIRIIAILGIASLTAINCFSLKWTNRVQIICTSLKLAALVTIGLIGFSAITQSKSLFTQPIFQGTSSNPADYALALYTALWAYDGWSSLNLVTGNPIIFNTLCPRGAQEPHKESTKSTHIRVSTCHPMLPNGEYRILRSTPKINHP